MRWRRTDGFAGARAAQLRRWQRDCVRSDDCASGRDSGLSRGAGDCCAAVSREDGDGGSQTQSGTVDVGRSAGFGGHDCNSADCILLWQQRDAGLLAFFIGKITDAAEKERSWERYHIIRRFVDSNACRHRQICLHFGERLKREDCGACDVCGSVPGWLSAPVEGVRRKRKRFAPAVASPLRIGRGPAKEAAQPGAQQARIPVEAGTKSATAAVDPQLREYLREWRRVTAKEQGVSAFIVMY